MAVAVSNTKNELWPLMGYELRSKLASQIDDQDFLAGSKACDITDGTCEACQ